MHIPMIKSMILRQLTFAFGSHAVILIEITTNAVSFILLGIVCVYIQVHLNKLECCEKVHLFL